MKKKIVDGIMLVLCLIIFLFSSIFLNSSRVSAEQETVIYVDPTPVTAIVCENFTVGLNIKNVEDLFYWQFELSWNSSLLECLGAAEGPFLRSHGSTFCPNPMIDNDEGTIIMGCVLLGPPGVNGSGTLAYIEFRCKGVGECDLAFISFNTFLWNSNFTEIPYAAVNGHVIQREIPGTIIVPDDYPTIQAAINAANDGGCVCVRAGMYYENLIINQTFFY